MYKLIESENIRRQKKELEVLLSDIKICDLGAEGLGSLSILCQRTSRSYLG